MKPYDGAGRLPSTKRRNPGALREVGQVGWGRGVVDVVESRAELRHRVVREAGEEDDDVGRRARSAGREGR